MPPEDQPETNDLASTAEDMYELIDDLAIEAYAAGLKDIAVILQVLADSIADGTVADLAAGVKRFVHEGADRRSVMLYDADTVDFVPTPK